MTLNKFTRADLSRLAATVGVGEGPLGLYVTLGRFGGYDIRRRQAEDVRFADDPTLFHGPIRECRAYLMGRADSIADHGAQR